MRICKLWNLALGIMATPFRGGRLPCLSTAYVNPLTAPAKDTDELPIDPINLALLLARFFYEHLFPMSADPQTPITTQLLE